jgi:hypothetical protein
MRDSRADLNKMYAHVDALMARYSSMSLKDATQHYFDDNVVDSLVVTTLDSPAYEERDVWSSCVKTVGYDRRSNDLNVVFHNGGQYAYRGVPEDVYKDFIDTASYGQFLNREIKHRYPCAKISC